tara:strand:- start:490 stop:816 length:327 start_codon:yes stop_codon:yes gene_type:complete
MDEDKMRVAMMEFERKRAKLGLRAALPDDKKRRKTREPLTRYELHILTFMRSEGVMDLVTLAGAMDETKQEMLEQLHTLIDRGYVVVVSDRGYAKYRARGKHEIQNNS